MEEFGLARFDLVGNAARKRRTQTSRRPKPESQVLVDGHDHSPSLMTPTSGDVGKASSDENVDTDSRNKEFNLNQCMSRNRESERCDASYSNDTGQSALSHKRSSEGVLAPANWKNRGKMEETFGLESINANSYSGRNGECQNVEHSGGVLESIGNDNKVKKVKLKVGGVVRTIHANSTANGSTSNSTFSNSSRINHNLQEKGHLVLEKNTGLQGIPWKDFSTTGFSLGKESTFMGNTSGKESLAKQGEKSESVRNSKRVPKRRVLDEEIGEDYEDDEIRYLEKLRIPKLAAGYKGDEESGRKQRRLSSLEGVGTLKPAKDGKKKTPLDLPSEDADYEEEEDVASEGELEVNKKKQKRESVDSLIDGKREMTLTTRQRALQSSRDGSASGANFIEFPNGLPPAPSRKQKEKLTDMELQLKKAEAAHRRRIQVENAARESQAEAIRKILGQDSSRKKREDKIKKRQEELAQEKAANAMMLRSNTIRCIMGPTGTVVTFSSDMGLPSIFDSNSHSYPPPREKCAGPSCTNPYKYRDSKSKIPLCSLQCYKAVQKKTQAEAC